MVSCFYKKTFLKDLARLPQPQRKQVEKLVFEQIPQLDSISTTPNVKKMKGYQHFYRIRFGDYRIGCELKEANNVIFYRIKSRSDIYKLFP
jgi:mRNA interferase RelE/StbE